MLNRFINIAKSVIIIVILLSVYPLQADNEFQISLEGEWKYIATDKSGFSDPAFDDSSWASVKLPANNLMPLLLNDKRRGSRGEEGYFWLRKSFKMTAMPSVNLHFQIREIMNVDEVFINGTKIGKTGNFPPHFRSGWSNFRSYEIPDDILQKGENSISIRVYYNAEAWVLSPLRIVDQQFAESQKLVYDFFLIHALQGFSFLLISISLFFGIFYIQRSQETEYLYFSFSALAVAISISLSFIENVYPALPFSSNAIFVFTQSGLLTFLPFLSLFIHQYTEKKISIFRKIFSLIIPFLAIMALSTAHNRSEALFWRNNFLLVYAVYLLDIIFHSIKLVRRNDKRGIMIILAIFPTILLGIHDSLAFSVDMFEFKIALFVYGFPILLLIIAVHLTSRFVTSLNESEKLNVVFKETMDSFARFVPVQFLNHLKKSKITDVKVGDAIRGDMTVIFCDIRNFTSMSEDMSPDDNFKFLNSYLEQMEPSIKKHHGFVDKFIGDAIMALFSDSADQAIHAAIDMRRALRTYNEKQSLQNKPPIEFGIGINSGEVILGTVGTSNRMDTTVIGEAVNLASRIESLTKIYNSPILISSHVYERLSNPEDFGIREIDLVMVRGSRKAIKVYEIYDADDFATVDRKRELLPTFSTALSLYRSGQFLEAWEYFARCLKIMPEDIPCKIYIERCKKYLETPPTGNWTEMNNLYQPS